MQQTLQTEYRASDPGITLALADDTYEGDKNQDIRSKELAKSCFTQSCAQKVISAMLLVPYGVLHMSGDIPGLVETSNNIGVMVTTLDAVTMDCALRSSVSSRRLFVRAQIEALAEALGAEVTFKHGYPGWAYNPDSPLLAEATDEYRRLYNKNPNIEAVHAGLECGFMMEKIPDMDIISYGSKIYDVHTPNEHLSIPSLERVWKYTLALLNRL